MYLYSQIAERLFLFAPFFFGVKMLVFFMTLIGLVSFSLFASPVFFSLYEKWPFQMGLFVVFFASLRELLLMENYYTSKEINVDKNTLLQSKICERFGKHVSSRHN